jgi:hypothetical protein
MTLDMCADLCCRQNYPTHGNYFHVDRVTKVASYLNEVNQVPLLYPQGWHCSSFRLPGPPVL